MNKGLQQVYWDGKFQVVQKMMCLIRSAKEVWSFSGNGKDEIWVNILDNW